MRTNQPLLAAKLRGAWAQLHYLPRILALAWAVLLPFGFWLPPALRIGTLPAFGVVLHYDLCHQERLDLGGRHVRSWAAPMRLEPDAAGARCP
jgi:hypothetical protein